MYAQIKLLLVFLLAAALAAGCNAAGNVACGQGTELKAGVCVAKAMPNCGAGTVLQAGLCVLIADGSAADTATADTAEPDGADSAAADAPADASLAGQCSPQCGQGQVCQFGQCVAAPPPSGWQCATAFFGDGAVCNCGCGVPDPDCASAATPVIGCLGANTPCKADGNCGTCAPGCSGKVCGDDGCLGSCGACIDPLFPQCQAGKCVACTPSCQGSVCGDDGCGGSCGNCASDKVCTFGQCLAPPPAASCVNHCGGVAPSGCACTADCATTDRCCKDVDVCGCIASCAGKVCGDDGCGATCGTCKSGQLCKAGACAYPACSPATCNGHGNCNPNTVTCTCSDGYQGDYCDICPLGQVGFPNCATPCSSDAGCDDKEPCTTDNCSGGACVHLSVQATCTGGDACVQFACVGGTCQPATTTNCDDNNACSIDSCDAKAGCAHLPSSATSCQDDKPCTSGDVCNGMVCKGGTLPTNCDDANTCTADSCDAVQGCVHAATGNACATPDLCSVGGVCSSATCASVGAKNCSDGLSCTLDSCAAGSGKCQHTAMAAGTGCDDNVACTKGDTCDNQGNCTAGAAACALTVGIGLQAHYAAWNLPSLVLATGSGGQTVVGWQDLSGNSRHLSAADPDKLPVAVDQGVQGVRGIQLGGAAGLATKTWPTPAKLSVFAVWCSDGKGKLGLIASQGAVGAGWSLDGGATELNWSVAAATGGMELSVGGGSCFVAAARGSAAGRSVDLIQTSTVTQIASGADASTAAASLMVGASGSNLVLGELLIYDRVVSDAERDAIATYLRTAWNFAAPAPTFVWYDASDADSVVTDPTGNAVTTWKDKSGLGRHASVGKDAAPIWYASGTANAKPAVRFDGPLVRLQSASVPSVPNMTVFAVIEMDKPMSWGSVISQGQDAYFALRKSDCCGGNGQLNWHIGNNNGAPLLPLGLGNWRVVTAVQTGVNSSFYSNVDAATATSQIAPIGAGAQILSLGNSFSGAESMGGFIAEVRAYASALSPVDRAFVQGLLKGKYGL